MDRIKVRCSTKHDIKEWTSTLHYLDDGTELEILRCATCPPKELEFPRIASCKYCDANIHMCTCCVTSWDEVGFPGSRLGVYSFDAPFAFDHSCPKNEGRNHESS